ncbi:hypothetical protein H6G20_25215 [Desertifilum sp. FACHB-1129]|uniref:CopG family transcriptional regulator n=2 Tax=Desertifilum tharense IPPAS B-1220 TaxID=1781255 RepID=A0A1E5QFU1_9CYAN|nr:MULTISPECIES: CopG family transcriptional regulator [Desertifilum]MDA0208893.1 ribbon-helix-helix domain-containing protein [Cyanobacteria bacterium FC1]MBD2314972.1 hypothetical protein [Desertifilum sp. FACHB-1129]MBD2321499.1 hypothetical protein [Desertifilum sp. FACHB-866]MBD2331194.1 hypothetical protein [Desertifilum sp. FACHB-868]OEJ73203.1 hypothetical protein BH720_20975 [Desertifilum tharense IPPAS B-1220]
MATHHITVELTDEEISILKRLADARNISATAALKHAIITADYLERQTRDGKQIFIGEMVNNTVQGSLKTVNIEAIPQ